MSDLDPDVALNLVHGARQSVAERVGRSGWVFDIGFAAMAGGVVASWAFAPPYDIVGYSLCGAGLYVLAYMWARRTGLRLGGVSRGRARRASIIIAIAISVGILAVAWFAKNGFAWAAAPVGAGAAVAGFLVSRGWRRMWLRDIRRLT
jgi:hypothetical protein